MSRRIVLVAALCGLALTACKSGSSRTSKGDVVPSSAPYTAQCGQWFALTTADKKLALLRLYIVDISTFVVYASQAPIPHYVIHMTPATTAAGIADVDGGCTGVPANTFVASMPLFDNISSGKNLPPGIVIGDPPSYSSKSSYFSANP